MLLKISTLLCFAGIPLFVFAGTLLNDYDIAQDQSCIADTKGE